MPKEHQKIRFHIVFDVKHCGKFKERLVADGHLTKGPNKMFYSGVVSLRNISLAMFLSELNDLQLWGVDVGNAYLQALTTEKLYIVAGPEFEEFQGMILLCTRHSMVQDLEEHVGMTNSLTFFMRWTPNLQKQILIYE